MNSIKLQKMGLYTLLFLNLGFIIYFWIVGSHDLFTLDATNIFLAMGRLTGLIAVYAILLQFLLMGRVSWLEKVFGFDRLAHFHRLNGYFAMFFILIHPILLTIAYAREMGVQLQKQFIDFLSYEDILPAFISVALFVLIVVLSITIVRKKMKYESWYFVHLLTYLAILLAYGHQIALGGDFLDHPSFVMYWYFLYAFVFVNFLLFRFFRPIYNYFFHRFTVSDLVLENSDTTSVYIHGKNIQKFKFQPGQFLFVRFLMNGFWTQSHPFSISSVPGKDVLRITVKNLGDYTAKIPSLKKGASVLIDGPCGKFTAVPGKNVKYLFLAGGVGITPIRSMIEQVASTNDVILLYSSRTSSDIVFKNEFDPIAKQYGAKIYYVLTDEKEYEGEQGRIDQEKLGRLIPDICDREVYICGPLPMIDALNTLLTAQFAVSPEHIHFEKFSL